MKKNFLFVILGFMLLFSLTFGSAIIDISLNTPQDKFIIESNTEVGFSCSATAQNSLIKTLKLEVNNNGNWDLLKTETFSTIPTLLINSAISNSGTYLSSTSPKSAYFTISEDTNVYSVAPRIYNDGCGSFNVDIKNNNGDILCSGSSYVSSTTAIWLPVPVDNCFLPSGDYTAYYTSSCAYRKLVMRYSSDAILSIQVWESPPLTENLNFNKNISEETEWRCSSIDTSEEIYSSQSNTILIKPMISLNIPSNNSDIINALNNFSFDYIENNFPIINSTFYIWDQDGTEYKQGISLTTFKEIGDFEKGEYFWNVKVCGINKYMETYCFWGEDYYFNVKDFVINSISENSQLFETQNREFQINLESTYNIQVKLIYDEKEYDAIKTQDGNTQIFKKLLNVGTIEQTGNKTYSWKLIYNDKEETIQKNQSIIKWNVGLTEPNKILKVNIRDEQTGALVNQTTLSISSNYYIDEGFKKYFFNSEELDGVYDFGVSSTNMSSFIMDAQFSYSSLGYQKRNYLDILTFNPLLSETLDLYLLLKDEGIIQFFRVSDDLYKSLSGALVVAYRIEGNNEILVDTITTDEDGEGNLFLNPDEEHLIKVFRNGCTPYQKKIFPTGLEKKELFLECESEESSDYSLKEFETTKGLTAEFTNKRIDLQPGAKVEVSIKDKTCSLESFKLIIQQGESYSEISSSVACGEKLELSVGNLTGEIQAFIQMQRNGTIEFQKKYFIYSIGDYEAKVNLNIWDLIKKLKLITDFGLSKNTKIFFGFIILFGIISGLSSERFDPDSLGVSITIWVSIFCLSLFGFLEISATKFEVLNQFAICILSTMLTASIWIQKQDQ